MKNPFLTIIYLCCIVMGYSGVRDAFFDKTPNNLPTLVGLFGLFFVLGLRALIYLYVENIRRVSVSTLSLITLVVTLPLSNKDDEPISYLLIFIFSLISIFKISSYYNWKSEVKKLTLSYFENEKFGSISEISSYIVNHVKEKDKKRDPDKFLEQIISELKSTEKIITKGNLLIVKEYYEFLENSIPSAIKNLSEHNIVFDLYQLEEALKIGTGYLNLLKLILPNIPMLNLGDLIYDEKYNAIYNHSKLVDSLHEKIEKALSKDPFVYISDIKKSVNFRSLSLDGFISEAIKNSNIILDNTLEILYKGKELSGYLLDVINDFTSKNKTLRLKSLMNVSNLDENFIRYAVTNIIKDKNICVNDDLAIIYNEKVLIERLKSKINDAINNNLDIDIKGMFYERMSSSFIKTIVDKVNLKKGVVYNSNYGVVYRKNKWEQLLKENSIISIDEINDFIDENKLHIPAKDLINLSLKVMNILVSTGDLEVIDKANHIWKSTLSSEDDLVKEVIILDD